MLALSVETEIMAVGRSTRVAPIRRSTIVGPLICVLHSVFRLDAAAGSRCQHAGPTQQRRNSIYPTSLIGPHEPSCSGAATVLQEFSRKPRKAEADHSIRLPRRAAWRLVRK